MLPEAVLQAQVGHFYKCSQATFLCLEAANTCLEFQSSFSGASFHVPWPRHSFKKWTKCMGPWASTPAIVLILQDTSANGRQNTFPIHSTAFPSLIFFTAYPSLASLSQSHCNMDFAQNDLPGALSVIIEKSSDFHFHRGRFGRLL